VRRFRSDALLPLALGFADGILNALTVAAASMLGGEAHATAGLAGRIGVAAFVTAGFAVIVADYADSRGGLRHASRQLNLESESGLAGTRLGRDALRRAGAQSLLAAASSLLGAALPLLLAAALPGPGWIAVAVAVAALGTLGAALASVVLGSRVRWALALVAGGIAVTAVGAWLKIA
jgi:predicted membrane protein (TIGR00267 family)